MEMHYDMDELDPLEHEEEKEEEGLPLLAHQWMVWQNAPDTSDYRLPWHVDYEPGRSEEG